MVLRVVPLGQVHDSQVQDVPHVCFPSPPQPCEFPGEQAPPPLQVLHALHVPALHVRVWVPALQFPHAWLDAPEQVGSTQGPQSQFSHTCVPPLPQAWGGCPGSQGLPPVHAPQGPQTPLLQVRSWIPVLQLPQFWLLAPEQS